MITYVDLTKFNKKDPYFYFAVEEYLIDNIKENEE